MKKKILILLFLIYWIFTFIYMLNKESNKLFYLFVYLILFMPLTITMILEYDVPALFIIILDQAVECILGFFMCINIIASFSSVENSLLLLVSSFVSIFLGISIIISCIKLFKNKNNSLKYYVLILGIIRVIFLFISFLMTKDYSFIAYSEFIKNLVFIAAICIYIGYFPQKQIKIFKE